MLNEEQIKRKAIRTREIFLVALFIVLVDLFLLYKEVYPQQKFVVSCDSKLLTQSEKILFLQVGVREKTGHNDGEMVSKYLKSVGLSIGYPYCAAGQYYCFASARKGTQIIPIARTGLANGIFNDAKRNGVAVNYVAKRHDLIVWKTPEKSTGHIERIYVYTSAGNAYTVGFNTGGSDPREGDGVFKKKRNLCHPLGRMGVRGLIGFTF